MQIVRRGYAFLTSFVLGSIPTGCSIPHDIGFAERCADIMQLAFPGATIEIGKSGASATGLTTIIARVEGVRNDIVQEGPLTRDLGVECQFDNNILTGFRWTAGPLH